MDTSSALNPACGDTRYIYIYGNLGPVYYYSVHGKYPKSSASLLKEVKTFLAGKTNLYSGSGYITFRFTIDCTGHMLKKVQVLQTDESYHDFHFDKVFVNELYDYVKTLAQWKPTGLKSQPAINYMAFITFKIRDGKVINIIP